MGLSSPLSTDLSIAVLLQKQSGIFLQGQKSILCNFKQVWNSSGNQELLQELGRKLLAYEKIYGQGEAEILLNQRLEELILSENFS